MLRWRLLLGSLFIGALVALCWLDAHTRWPLPPLFLLALVVSMLASGEVLWLLSARDLRPLPWVVYGGNFLIVASNIFVLSPAFWRMSSLSYGLEWPTAALALSLILAFLGEMARYRASISIVNLALAVFSHLYVGLLMTFVIQLRDRYGMLALVSLIAVVKAADIGAYATGRLLGRRKMTPILSPGKTWEGAVGGLFFGSVASWLVFMLSPLDGRTYLGQPWGWLVYGIIVSIAGMVGDLAESLFKRDMGRKDSSAWMPGFGGVLDLLDSILLAAPVAYICWIAGLLGP